MGITILPYIEKDKVTKIKSKKTNSNNISGSKDNFSTILDKTKNNVDKTSEEKAVAAKVVDKLISSSKNKSIDVKDLQNYFDKNGIDIKIAYNNTISAVPTVNYNNNGSATSNNNTTDKKSNTSINSKPSINTTGATSKVNSSNNTGVLQCSEYLDKIFEKASKKYNVDVKLLKSVAKAESNFDPNSKSCAGAIGIMQLMPATAESLGVSNPYDPTENIMGGAKLLSQFLKKYNNDLPLTLAAYNAGPGNVSKYGGIPPFQETQNYVKKVINFYNS